MRQLPRKQTYEILVPPLNKTIFHLSESEAALYYEWFIQQIPQRIEYLSHICASDLKTSVDSINLTPESLLSVWKWFQSRAETEPLKRINEKTDHTTVSSQSNRKEPQLTLQTEYIIRDIGMYLGETFIKNHNRIYWTYYTNPRNDFFVNHPLLKGFVDRSFDPPFEMCFEPIHMVGVQAAKILDDSSQTEDLLNLYQWWAERT